MDVVTKHFSEQYKRFHSCRCKGYDPGDPFNCCPSCKLFRQILGLLEVHRSIYPLVEEPKEKEGFFEERRNRSIAENRRKIMDLRNNTEEKITEIKKDVSEQLSRLTDDQIIHGELIKDLGEQVSRLTSDQLVHGEMIKGLGEMIEELKITRSNFAQEIELLRRYVNNLSDHTKEKVKELEGKNSALVEMIARRSGRIAKLEMVMARVEASLISLNVNQQCEYYNMP